MSEQSRGERVIESLKQIIDFENGDTSKGRVHIVEKPAIEPVADYSKDQIREIRRKNNFTQKTFAEFIGVTPKAIEAWEAGTRKPTGTVRRLFQIMEKDLDVISDMIIRQH